MVLVFVLGTFGMNFQLTMALMATKVFDKGAGEYGLLGSIMAVGSLAAALLSARRARPRMRVLLVALAGFTVSTALLATAPTYVLFAVYLVPTGLAALTALTTANAMVQISVDPVMRGRVMALYMAIFMGGTPSARRSSAGSATPGGRAGPSASAPSRSGSASRRWPSGFARRQNVAVTFQTQRRPRLRSSARTGQLTPQAAK